MAPVFGDLVGARCSVARSKRENRMACNAIGITIVWRHLASEQTIVQINTKKWWRGISTQEQEIMSDARTNGRGQLG